MPAEPRLASARPLRNSGDQMRRLGGSDSSAAARAAMIGPGGEHAAIQAEAVQKRHARQEIFRR